MNEVQLTAEDRKMLIEANGLYLFDWRENDDDQATAGWRHPGYFLEVGKSFDFEKLVSMGLMEKGGNPDYITYRISELGMAKVDELEAPASPDAVIVPEGDDWDDEHGGDYDDSGYSELLDELVAQIKRYERALLECITQMNKHGNDDNWETVTMDYAAAIKNGREALKKGE